jgi:hypothetical protein
MCDYFLIFKCFANQKKNLTKALNVIIFLPSPPKNKVRSSASPFDCAA